jgi:hypothetical protein
MDSLVMRSDFDGHRGHSLMNSPIRNEDCNGLRGHSPNPWVNGECERQEVVHLSTVN